MSTRTHGHTRAPGGGKTPTYRCWQNMLTRCRNPKNQDFHYYGGRGIKVCGRWLKFENFLADMGEKPAGMSLDRINSNGDYEPANCRWATAPEQSRNRRSTRLSFEQAIECNFRLLRGERACNLAREYGLHKTAINRMKRGLSWPDALAIARVRIACEPLHD